MPLLNSNLKKKKNKLLNLRKKIYFSISSEGLGHSSRTLAIIKEFKHDEVLVGTYNYALERLQKSGYPCVELQQELELVGAQGTFDVGKTITKNYSWTLIFNKLVKDEIDIIKSSGASCVVADGRLIPVMAADKLGLPCIVITNQSAFYPFFKSDSPIIRAFGKSFDLVMKKWLSSAEEIMIPDFPPPYTICLPNLSRSYSVMKRTRFVGPLVSWDKDDITGIVRPDTKRPYVVVTLGGHSYRRPLLDNVIQIAAQLPDVDFDLFTSFKVDNLPDNVKIIGIVPNLSQYLKAADLVITQAGHSTAMELLTLGKPSIIVPDLKQIEQENNAGRMSEFEVTTQITYDELSAYKLGETIKKMLDSSKYKKNAEHFAEMALEIKGRKNAAQVLDEYAERLLYY